MSTKVIFNIDPKVKERAMRKASHEGINLSLVLNLAAKAYADDRLGVDLFGEMIKEARNDLREGKTVSQQELFARLGL